MKLSGRDAPGYFARPDPRRTGLLIYGADAMRVALRRQEVIAALIGPQGEEEMRLARMSGAELRKEPAMLLDAIKAQGFFPGPRVVFVEDATDALAPIVTGALSEWREGDAQVIMTAGQLKPASKLRKLFEGHNNAYAVGIYDEPPGRAEIETTLAKAGLRDINPDAMRDLTALAQELDPGDFRRRWTSWRFINTATMPLCRLMISPLAPQPRLRLRLMTSCISWPRPARARLAR